MLKRVIDTNIFIDRFADPTAYRDLFLSDGLVYLSAVVLMELRTGAHSKKSLTAVHELVDFFKRVDRLVLPTLKDYERAGELVAKLQATKGYTIRKSASISNDCLIAASVRGIGGVLHTQNKKDFQAIRDVFDFEVIFVQAQTTKVS